MTTASASNRQIGSEIAGLLASSPQPLGFDERAYGRRREAAGHTTGATSYLWETGNHGALLTGDTIYLDEGERTAGILGDSDPDAYIETLELIRELDFDLLVPSMRRVLRDCQPTNNADRRTRVDTILGSLSRGAGGS